MPGPEHELRYSRALVARGVRRFVGWRILPRGRRLLIAGAVLLACAAVLATGGEPGWAAGLVAIAAGPWLLGLIGWAAHLAYKLRRLRAMGAPVAAVTVEPDGLRFRSGAGEGVLAFANVTAWREWPDLWLLLTAPNRFTILPAAGLSVAVLDELRERLGEIEREW